MKRRKIYKNLTVNDINNICLSHKACMDCPLQFLNCMVINQEYLEKEVEYEVKAHKRK